MTLKELLDDMAKGPSGGDTHVLAGYLSVGLGINDTLQILDLAHALDGWAKAYGEFVAWGDTLKGLGAV